jgi:hypothetical protein
MAEWSKAAVLKTVSRQRDVGSNPTPSAIKSLRDLKKGQKLFIQNLGAFPERWPSRSKALAC